MAEGTGGARLKAIGCILVSWFLFYIGVEESPAIDNKMLWIIHLLLVFSAVFLVMGLVMLAIE
jgi:hypothetical protein